MLSFGSPEVRLCQILGMTCQIERLLPPQGNPLRKRTVTGPARGPVSERRISECTAAIELGPYAVVNLERSGRFPVESPDCLDGGSDGWNPQGR